MAMLERAKRALLKLKVEKGDQRSMLYVLWPFSDQCVSHLAWSRVGLELEMTTRSGVRAEEQPCRG